MQGSEQKKKVKMQLFTEYKQNYLKWIPQLFYVGYYIIFPSVP